MATNYVNKIKEYAKSNKPVNYAAQIRERIEEENKNIIATDLQQKANAFNQRVYEKNYNNAKFDTLDADLKTLGKNLNDLFANKNYKTQEEMDVYSNDLNSAINRLTSARNVLDLADREKNKEAVNSLNSQINNLKEALTAVQDFKQSFNSFVSKEEYDIVKSFGEKTPEQLQEEVEATRKLTRDIARDIAHWESKQVSNEKELQEKRDVINALKNDLEKARKQEGSLETAVKKNWANKGLAQKKVEELSKAGYWENIGFAVESGFDQFFSGMQYKGKRPDYMTTSATGQAAGAVRENVVKKYGFWGGLAYDAVNTYSNMAIPQAISRVPVLGSIVGTYFMGESARGNAYKEAIQNKGMNKQQANLYATLVGASEAGLSYALGGVGKLGGKVTEKLLDNITKNITNGIAKFSIKFAGKFGSEYLEEGSQNVLGYAFENIAKGEPVNQWEDIDWGEAAYEALLGGLMGGFLGGQKVAVETMQELNTLALKKIGSTVNNNIESNPQLLENLKSLDVDSSIKKEIGNVVINDDVAATGKSILKIQSSILTEIQSRLSSALQQVGINKVEAPIVARQMIDALYKSANIGSYTNDVEKAISLFSVNSQTSQIFKDFQNGAYGGDSVKLLAKLAYNSPKNLYRKNTQSSEENANLGENKDGAISQGTSAFESDNNGTINPKADKGFTVFKPSQALKSKLEKVASKFGLTIEYFKGDPDTVGNGSYTKGTKVIRLNETSQKPTAIVFAHELVHYLVQDKLYSRLQNILFKKGKDGKYTVKSAALKNWIKQKQLYSLDIALERYAETYKTEYAKKDANGNYKYDAEGMAKVEEELIADFLADALFGQNVIVEGNDITEQFATEVFEQDQTLWEKIKEWFANVVAQFKEVDDIQQDLKRIAKKLQKMQSNLAKQKTSTEKGEARKSKSVDIYTEEQYNNFGWTVYNNVLDNQDIKYLSQEILNINNGNNRNYVKTRFNDYIIPIDDKYNIIVYVDDNVESPHIRKVLEINSDNQAILDMIRSDILDANRNKLPLAHEYVKRIYGEENFVEYKNKDFRNFQQYAESRRKGNISQDDSRLIEERGNGQRPLQQGVSEAEQLDSAFSMPKDERKSLTVDAEYLELAKDPQKNEARLREMVDEAAKDNGYNENLFHQTENDFYAFETRHKGAGTRDNETPFGIFMKKTDRDIGIKGKKQMSLFAKFENPLIANNREALVYQLKKLSPEYREIKDKLNNLDKEYQEKFNSAKNAWRDWLNEWRKKNPNAERREAYNDPQFEEIFSLEEKIVDEWSAEASKLDIKAKEIITDALINNGFDGVFLLEDKGSFGRITETYIALDPNQVKSADLVTYDEKGDIIPLSERFKDNNADIRYSLNIDLTTLPESELSDAVENETITREQAEQELMRRYGKIPNSFKPKQNIVLTAEETQKEDFATSEFINNVLRNGKFDAGMTEEQKAEIIKAITDYKEHRVITDKTAIEKTQALIERDYQKAVWEWEDYTNQSKYVPLGKEELALGQQLLQHAAENGNAADTVKYLAELTEAATRAGQAVQSFSLLKKMGGIGRLYYVNRTLATINKDIKKRFGNSDKAKLIELDSDLALMLANAKTQKEIDAILPNIYQSISEQMPKTFIDKWNTWRYLSMLGNPRTHFRNIAGNGMFTVVRFLRDFLSAAAQLPMKTENRTRVLFTDAKYRKFAREYFEEHKNDILQHGRRDDLAYYLQNSRKPFGNKGIDKPFNAVANFNFDALEQEDNWFKRINFVHSMAQYLQAKNIDLNNVSKEQLNEAQTRATQEAREATFQDENFVAKLLTKFSRDSKAGQAIIEGVIPFKRTPLNIVKQGVYFSPLGLVRAIKQSILDVQKGEITAAELIDSYASALTGTGLLVLGVLLSGAGIAIGGLDSDDEEDKAKKMNGIQEYSLNIGGVNYTVDWLVPASVPFFMGVELQKMFSDEEQQGFLETISNVSEKVMDPIVNLSMLAGLNDLLDAIKWGDGSNIGGLLLESLSSFLLQGAPTIFGQISRTFDDTRRTTYVDKNSPAPDFIQEFIQSVQSKIPGWENKKTPYINAWGETQSTGSFGGRAAQNFISPGYVSSVKDDPITKELIEIYLDTDKDGSVLPQTPSKSFTVNGQNKYLTADEYVTFAKEVGQAKRKYLEEAFSNSAFDGLSAEQKATVVKNLYGYATANGKTSISDYELSNTVQKIKNLETIGVSPVTFYIASALTSIENADANNSGSVTKKEKKSALKNSGIDNSTANKILNYDKKDFE